MMHEAPAKKREQISLACVDVLVPQNHLLRKIGGVIDWTFIYDLIKEKYSPDMGRPSMGPVVLIKIVIIQYLYGIRSVRQTIREIKANLAYRWFLGLRLYEKAPHFSTFGKNYTRRFKGTDLFEQIFSTILQKCMDAGLVDPSETFIDATHGNESRAYVRVYKSQEAGPNNGREFLAFRFFCTSIPLPDAFREMAKQNGPSFCPLKPFCLRP